MHRVLAAETAVLVHFKSVRVIFLVLHCVVVSLLAFGACQCDSDSHDYTSRYSGGTARTADLRREASGRSRFNKLSPSVGNETQKSLSEEVHPFYHVFLFLSRNISGKTADFQAFFN